MKPFFKKQFPIYASFILLFFFVNHDVLHSLVAAEFDDIRQNVSLFLLGSRVLYFVALVLLSYFLSLYPFKRTFVLKLSALYAAYCILAYITDIAFNLNNEKYKMWDFARNHLFQPHFMLSLNLIVVYYLLFRYVINRIPFFKDRMPKLPFPEKFDHFLLSQFLLSFILTNSHMADVISHTGFLEQKIKGLGQGDYGNVHFLITMLLIFFLTILGSLVCFVIIQGMSDFRKNNSSYSLAIAASFILAVIFNFAVQMSIGNGVKLLGYSLFPGAMSFQILLLFLLFFSLYLIINQFWITSNLIIIVSSIFVYSNSIKFSMRGEPILPSDLAWLMLPNTLLGFVDKSFITYAVIALIILLVLFFVLKRFLFTGKITHSLKVRFFCLSAIVVMMLALLGIFFHKKDGFIIGNIPILSVLNNGQNITWMGNTNNARYKSLAYVWINQLTTDVMERPDGYSKKNIKKIEKKYKNLADQINQERNENAKDQTIIYILSESFSDPERVDGVSLNQTPITNIHQIKEETTSGLMKSDGYGGGTANMEFQTLTGLPFYNLSQSVAVLYTEVFPKMNYVPSISNLYSEQNRIAIHLANPSNYSRNYVYKALDFDKFISDRTKGIKETTQGVYPSDASTYQLILDNLDASQGQFFSVMTMQNHAPWSEENPPDIEGSGQGFTDEENSKLNNYIHLLYHTDNSTKDFLEQLSKLDKKVTVVFYGDHLPGLYPTSAFKSNPASQYQTDYFIWSNKENVKMDYPLVNSSDFSAMVLEQTNSKVSPYYALLTNILHNASIDKKKLTKEQQEIADELKLVEYDMVRGKGYLSKNFFNISY